MIKENIDHRTERLKYNARAQICAKPSRYSIYNCRWKYTETAVMNINFVEICGAFPIY